jgi:hypothetical protein
MKPGNSTTEIWDGVRVEIKYLTWDHQHRKFVPKGDASYLRPENKCKWVQYHYEEQLELSKVCRNVLLAVQAELYRLHFRSFDRAKPVVLGNSVILALGFHRTDKVRALKELEKAGWITVQWRQRQSPLVTITKGFQL